MTDSLGLSIGMTNLVAARFGRDPVMRRAILTVFEDRPPEVGIPTSPGMVLSGFVDRVGDPVPLVAADGSAHRGEQVLAEALDAMARTAGGGAPVAIAVPAHWGPATVGALRGALRNHPHLAADGAPAALIPDSVAALAALQAAPGLPDEGVIVLCDFGGSGTGITLADASSNLDAVGQTVRHTEFSGDGVDQLLLNHVVTGIASADDADPAGTAAVGSLARLRDACRQAKERLSAETATAVPVDLPGVRTDFRVTRSELEQLISGSLAGVLAAVEETLQRNNIPLANVSAVATVGGGAAIPLVTQQLSERLRAPVVTTPQSQLNVAAGAALVAGRGLVADVPTGMAPIAPDAPTGLAPAADAPTGLAPAAWAAGAAGLAAGDSASDGASSATFRALAWSQDDAPDGEPVPYAGEDYTAGTGAARPPVAFAPGEEDEQPADTAPLAWYKRPTILFGAAAVAALAAISGLAVTLTSSVGDSSPVTETSTTYSMEPSTAAPPPPPVTTVTVGPDGRATTTVSQPPPPPPPPPTTTTTPPTTTTTSPTTTTATTTTTTRTTTTTTRPTTTSPPPTTTQPPPTTTVVPDPPDPPDPPTTVIVPDDGA